MRSGSMASLRHVAMCVTSTLMDVSPADLNATFVTYHVA